MHLPFNQPFGKKVRAKKIRTNVCKICITYIQYKLYNLYKSYNLGDIYFL